MHVTKLLNTHLSKQCQAIHKKRWAALMAVVDALIIGKKLTVTGLGRSIKNTVYTKHNIKRVDRLVGNSSINQASIMIHRAMAEQIIGNQKQPVVLVDWSDLSADGEFHLLRASLPIGGRALTLYDEVHEQKRVNNNNVHERFLERLKTCLPSHCRPIIITDAGFRTPWFRAVQAMGWDFVGRIPGKTMITPHAKADWIRSEPIFETATARPRYLGFVDIVRRSPLPCHAYLLKRLPKGRSKKTQKEQRCIGASSKKNAHRERTPWLIATSLAGGALITKRVISLYKTRMQIEESFRDVKNSRWGFGFNEARASTAKRYENLLLIGTLATYVVWLVGKVAESKNLHRHYQANTIKMRNVLSTFYLGCEVLRKQALDFRREEYQSALRTLTQDFKSQCYG
ncbi:IS4 family transposase [Sulfuriflexus sp.]|uniref:IS4 family transposase n=1 Tax=Sulfuriflexus sp. TaxID=2015443 RepID=UPI0028CF445A|nr:IS4 family transposase [Sulfuriflexus sp.]MDT8403936.1 IS4 family transposase [Sulfuriflexus sp.]